MTDRKLQISITGATGNMGGGFLEQLNRAPHLVDRIKILVVREKEIKRLKKSYADIADRFEFVIGSVSDPRACKTLVEGSDLVLNMCAVIPPGSDANPALAVDCNENGTTALIAAVEQIQSDCQPALLHISSVALYGYRTGEHIYGRVGEPLIPSPLDIYSATKLRGEFAVLQSAVKRWAVFRQTGLLHYKIFNNVLDGLLFHTTVNTPLEWVTVKDSGRLVFNFVRKFIDGELDDKFWKKVYNVGGGQAMRSYGYETYDEGFKIVGGGFKDFFKPYYNASRNFHGMWFTDSDELDALFGFRSQDFLDYWKEMGARHKIYKLVRILPKAVIRAFIRHILNKNANSPAVWAKNGEKAKIAASYGGEEQYAALKTKTWDDVRLLTDKPLPRRMTEQEKIAAYGYDIDKPDSAITKDDINAVANAHGGRCLTADAFDGDVYKNLSWENADGEKFDASVYTVMRAGHWYNSLYNSNVWDFDRLAKKDRLIARIWYDSHDPDEDNVYYFDENYKAIIEKIK